MSGSSTRTETVLDTSVWVAVAEADPRLARLPDVQGAREAVVSALSAGELASLVQRGRIHEDSFVAALADARLEPVATADCLTGGRLHGRLRRQGRGKASLADCIIYAAAQRLGIGLITLDGDLEGLPGVEMLGKKA